MMASFTASLPKHLLNELEVKSKQMSLSKNEIIEKALSIYFDGLNKAEFIVSFENTSEDKDLMRIADEGMSDYFEQLKNL